LLKDTAPFTVNVVNDCSLFSIDKYGILFDKEADLADFLSEKIAFVA
jgi:hypothetical protein